MPVIGRIQILSTEFASGWCGVREDGRSYIVALLDDRVIGTGLAELTFNKSTSAQDSEGPRRGSFLILFERPLDEASAARVVIRNVEDQRPFANAEKFQIDQYPICQIFVFGSPRSGTSELGNTISSQLSLPWLGECHAAPLFARAAEALDGDHGHLNAFPRLMAQEQYGKYVVERARQAYFKIHRSASFLDKTPGAPMIAAAPFIFRAFPDAKFIYLQRNGISNVLSRMVKFGGNFNSHCSGWAVAVNTWWGVRSKLPHFLEVRQEDMLNDPDRVARQVSDYLGVPEKFEEFVNSLRVGNRERTGAGLHRATFQETGWSEEQIRNFKRICGPTMERLGYAMI